MVTQEQLTTSRQYLNSNTISKKDSGGVIPLVIFPYRLGFRNVLACGCGVMSFIVPDLCIGAGVRILINKKVRGLRKYINI